MLFRKVKNAQGSKLFILGMKVYELRKTQTLNSTYLFGVKVRSKRPKGLIDSAVREAAEQRIRDMAECFRELPAAERHILCFDCLYDPLAEAIDAWTLFEYMQAQGIPCRYALLTGNPLYAELKAQNKLRDILPVESEFDLLRRYPEEIARSSRIFFSFPFTCSSILRDLPSIPFIFIEHGVNLMKAWCVRLYAPGGDSECNYILTPSKLTKQLYESMNLMPGKMLAGGLPRWDKLPPHRHDKPQRNIFVFFTWRTSFVHDKSLLGTYVNRITDFLVKLHELIADNPQIRLSIGLHHAFLLHNPGFDFSRWKHVNIVPTNKISSIIRETDLFITDYSSICFDLMYRDVPTIFYRFDNDLVYSNPMDNEAAVSAAEKDALLYNCCYEEPLALRLAEQYIRNGFVLEDGLARVNEGIFWQRRDNCRTLLELSANLQD